MLRGMMKKAEAEGVAHAALWLTSYTWLLRLPSEVLCLCLPLFSWIVYMVFRRCR